MTLPLSGNALSLEVLLEPIDPGQPCGPSLRYDPDYDRLRELRREDDSSLPTGVWQAEAKRADWAAVEQLASELLQRRSKDLMLAAWLGEAWLQRGGLGGLQRALVLLAELCERYPEEVHPQAQDGDQSWRVPPIDWLLRRYAELLHTRLPLMGQGAFAEITLYAWQRLQRQQVASGDSKSAKAALEAAQLQQKKLDEALRAEPLVQWQRKQASLLACQQQLQRLEQWCDRCLGELAPSCQPLREVIAQWLALLKEFIAMHPQQTLQAHRDLGGRWLLPIHNGTFDLAMHAWYEPFERILELATEHGVRVSTPMMGERIDLQAPHAGRRWWREVVDSEMQVKGYGCCRS